MTVQATIFDVIREEIWKDIDGYEGFYSISNTGKIKSIRKGDFLLKHPLSRGYPSVRLQANGVTITRRVHVLLAKHFIPNPENKREINHKNGIKSDNRLENLEWMTHRENLDHAMENNLMLWGERASNAKLTDQQAMEIINMKRGDYKREKLAKIYGVAIGTISDVRRGKTWKKIKRG